MDDPQAIEIILPVCDVCVNRIIHYLLFHPLLVFFVRHDICKIYSHYLQPYSIYLHCCKVFYYMNTWKLISLLIDSRVISSLELKGSIMLSVQFSHSVVSNSANPWTAARQASLSISNSWSSPKPVSIESVMPSNHLILCRPLLFPPSIFPSIRVFSNEAGLHIRWPMYWIQLQHQSFSFNISPSNEHPGLISFRMDWLDLLAVQGTLESLLHHHSSKASILQCSAFFIVNSHIHTWLLEKS